MKKLILRVTFAALSLASVFPVFASDTFSDGVVYKDKTKRFTVVADGLVRMEYAPDGKFNDDPSFVAYNRSYPETKAKVNDDGKTVTIETPKLILTYKKSKGAFSADNLSVVAAKGVKPFSWHPGTPQGNNLEGTTRTLDWWNGPELQWTDREGKWQTRKGQLEKGLLARDGWTLIDDSRGFRLDDDPTIPWVKKRKMKKGAQDLYFLGYGSDYKGALKDFTILSGKIPMPPRYAFGFWWSRWWAYSDHEVRELIDNFERYDIPVEVLVIDMDWHYTDEGHGGWTGWTWNRRLFPEPGKFLNFLRDKNLKVTLNLHPASGVKHYEEAYEQVARDNGIDPATKKDVPWVSSDRRFMESMFRNILDPMTKEGVSFWWIDWQQALYDSKVDSLNNTWWINHTFFNKMKHTEAVRPMIFHRWGGLGNHRYQIGFSGDSYTTWETLRYMPYFTSTASNVGYGYWGHDLGGFRQLPTDSVMDPELYARFFQFGVYSPIMRTHADKKVPLNKEPWIFDRSTLGLIRDAVKLRYRLVPYIYSMSRKAYDTGVSICRPMYYDYPELEEAYAHPEQYMFGERMIVAPVAQPAENGYSKITVWLPEGEWYEEATGTMLTGGKTYERIMAMDEYPAYIKAGSVIPYHQSSVGNLRSNAAPLSISIYPGGEGEFELYEDAGDDDRYDGEYAYIPIRSIRNGDTLTVGILPRKGSYDGMPESRETEIKIHSTLRPQKVTIDGKTADYTFLPDELAVVVNLGQRRCDTGSEIRIDFPADATIADGTMGDMRRFVKTFGRLKDRYADLEVTEEFGPMCVIAEALGYQPQNERQLIDSFKEKHSRLKEIVDKQPMPEETRRWFLSQFPRKR
ncbi:MAG: glycoside hydrolase family 31 protein [Muribaculaceae bacterium]|nr:glycoside hydrolase family 31 protein [Muribaculaceae bacterium]